VTDTSTIVLAEQELWRKRLIDAESCLHDADTILQRLTTEGARTDNARAERFAAREEYLRVLRIFTDLVLRGKSPAAEN